MKDEIVLKFPDTESLIAFTTAIDLKVCRIEHTTSTLYAVLGEAEIELAIHGFCARISPF